MPGLHEFVASTRGLRAYNASGPAGRVLKGWKWIANGNTKGSTYSYDTQVRALAGACRARKIDVISYLDDFTKHYLIAALWTEEENLKSADLYAITPELLEQAYADCQKFQLENRDELAAAYEQYDELGLSAHPDAGSAQACAGHDFWLSRNGHGTGFWDRGLSNGEALFAACKTYREVSLYLTRGKVAGD